MKDVRLVFEKRGDLKFISHLDMNRYFTRLLRRTKLDIWYTEGFNPHPYITFAMPLSLGFESTYEIVDFRVNDDLLTFEEIINAFKTVVTDDIKIVDAFTPVLKTGKIAFCKYILSFENECICSKFYKFLSNDSIIITKKSKRGEIKSIEVADKIKSFALCENNSVELILPAGNDNINPSSLVSTFCDINEIDITVTYLRTAILDSECNFFK